jgi:hypothetical protein
MSPVATRRIQLQGRPRSIQEDLEIPQFSKATATKIPKCLATGCEKYVRIENGIAISDYCSKKHAEYVQLDTHLWSIRIVR